MLTLNLKNGNPSGFHFVKMCMSHPDGVHIRTHEAPYLLPVLQQVKRNEKAAQLDARVDEFEIDHVEARTRTARDTHGYRFLRTREKFLVEKAKSIIDCLDMRNTQARVVRDGDISRASAKFGIVEFFLKAPIDLDIEAWDEASEPSGLRSVPGYNVSFRKFECDKIAILDYGNYAPPLVALGEKFPSPAYYLCPHLTRREQEKYGVEKLGFLGQ